MGAGKQVFARSAMGYASATILNGSDAEHLCTDSDPQ